MIVPDPFDQARALIDAHGPAAAQRAVNLAMDRAAVMDEAGRTAALTLLDAVLRTALFGQPQAALTRHLPLAEAEATGTHDPGCEDG